jgi:hypothetical protein
MKFFIFWYPFLSFVTHFLGGHILALFAKSEAKRARNGPKKQKLILQMCLRIKFCIPIWVWNLRLIQKVKLLYTNLRTFIYTACIVSVLST